MAELPFFDPIVEDEHHVLRTCPRYHDLRMKLSDTVKSSLFAEPSNIFSAGNLHESGRYILKIFKRRFPKKVSTPKDGHRPQKKQKKKK